MILILVVRGGPGIDKEVIRRYSMIPLQSKIEELQARRYYPLQEGWTFVDRMSKRIELTAFFFGCRDNLWRDALNIANDGHLKEA